MRSSSSSIHSQIMPGSAFEALHGTQSAEDDNGGYGEEDGEELENSDRQAQQDHAMTAAAFRTCKKCNRTDKVYEDCFEHDSTILRESVDSICTRALGFKTGLTVDRAGRPND